MNYIQTIFSASTHDISNFIISSPQFNSSFHLKGKSTLNFTSPDFSINHFIQSKISILAAMGQSISADQQQNQEQSISNRLTLIFGIFTTILGIASVLVGVYQYRQCSKNFMIEQDIEMQTAPPHKNSSICKLITDIPCNTRLEPLTQSTPFIDTPPLAYSAISTKVPYVLRYFNQTIVEY